MLSACGFSGSLADSPDPDASGGGPRDPGDRDGDGVAADDNCPATSNIDQLDGDGDGVGDACDSCAGVRNPSRTTLGFDQPVQRDHDKDGRGDECDPCPQIASSTDIDSDGDGIGDACDPQVNVKNPPAYFNGFYDPPDATWQVPRNAGTLADWTVVMREGGGVGWRQRTLDGSRRHQILLAGEKREHYIDSSLIIEAIAPQDAASPFRSAAVSYGFFADAADDIYFNCGVRHDAATNDNAITLASMQNDLVDDGQLQAWQTEVSNVSIRIVGVALRRGGTQPRTGTSSLSCLAGTPAPVTLANDVGVFPDGQIGLRTFGMSAWFDYVFYVEAVVAP